MRGFLVGLMLVAVSVAGCGSDARTGSDPVYPVTGVVTYKGQPVVGADIVFFSREKSRSAFGRTNDKGEYKLTTFSANDGAVEGQQIVTIAKTPPPAAPSSAAPIDSAAYEPPKVGESTELPPPKSDIPTKYASQETSGLTAIVNKEGANEANFELTD